MRFHRRPRNALQPFTAIFELGEELLDRIEVTRIEANRERLLRQL
jgi:hypothetical protein